ncbi:MAG: potassium-transporting ATPase subunit KdpC [Clostridium sp.]|uniref:potassium-transporting ATPase subunit KdpC n=1 Tax=Clostridium sp. TaxID=1506 RepID=UPI003F3D65DB
MDYIKKALRLSLIMFILCGGLYSLATTLIGQTLFPYEANGSILKVNNKEVGSELIGQRFTEKKYFMSRIPSTVNYNINTETPSSGSANLSVSSNELKERALNDIQNFLKENPTLKKKDISSELITESGSGLDPHITPRGAEIQIDRISSETGISKKILLDVIEKNIEKSSFGMYGVERVNVLKLNICIDEILNK